MGQGRQTDGYHLFTDIFIQVTAVMHYCRLLINKPSHLNWKSSSYGGLINQVYIHDCYIVIYLAVDGYVMEHVITADV